MPSTAKPTERRPWTDEYTLLCERCGYVIEGLAIGGNCPECGKPIAESLPERRTGTPWQRRSSWSAFARTTAWVLTKPYSALDQMSFEGASARSFQNRALWVSAIAAAGAWNAFLLDGHLNSLDRMRAHGGNGSFFSPFGAVMWVGSTLALAAVVHAALTILTATEASGLRVIGHQHRYRVTPAISRTICGFGSVGWLIGLVTTSMGMSIYFLNRALAANDDGSRLLLIPIATPFLVGFLFFEWFAWLGLRRCKFANRARPAPPPPTAPAAATAPGQPGAKQPKANPPADT